LRKVGSEEKEIEERLQKNIGETIGLTPRELPERFLRANAAFAENQATAHVEAQALQAEISRFFERTQQADYGQVNKEMAEARTSEELERVKGLIQDNISMEAMQNLVAWSERFAAWAENWGRSRTQAAAKGRQRKEARMIWRRGS
jgi:aminoglycoside phosphotransferase family enzyme